MSVLRHALCAAVLVCAFDAPALAANGCGCACPAVIIIRVPPGASVALQGVTLPETGGVRRFESPPLPLGSRYIYTVTAAWTCPAGMVTIQREVPVEAGREIVVDLRPEALLPRSRPTPAPSPRPAATQRNSRQVRAPSRHERHVRGPEPQRDSRQVETRPRAEAVPAARPVSRTDWLTTAERQVLGWTNAERRQAGLRPLTPDGNLTRIARQHAAAMARHGVMAHTLDGSSFDDRLAASGYAYRLAAENLAHGALTPREAVELWMGSPGHSANLLNSEHREIGLGLATGAAGERYYVQVFAAPAAW